MLKKVVFAVLSTFTLVNSDIMLLPEIVKPYHYVVAIEPNLTNVGINPSDFLGDVKIEVQALVCTKNITLHAAELDIDTSSIEVFGNEGPIPVKNAYYNRKNQMYTINLKQRLLARHFYVLRIRKYTGTFRPNSKGLFKVVYGPNDKTIAVTHFKPTFARYVFPCFDEPQLKARFIIHLIRSKDYHSISNEDLDRTEQLDDNRFMDVFKQTPIMSTYTVAFAISDFHSTERERHRIYAQQSAFEKNELQLPLDISIDTLKYLEEYLRINFTLNKMDSFAIPRGFYSYKAMESWGLITYDEEYIRCTNTSDYLTLKKVMSFIAHEFTHQWFGNLVTPASWDYYWLSESFATYFQFLIGSKVRPSWRLMDQIVIEIVQGSFNAEETVSSHGLNFEIDQYGKLPPLHIMNQKGGAIVWMMSHFLTEDLFRKALRNYLLGMDFENVVPADLYRQVQNTVDENKANHLLGNMTFSEILGTWDTFDGYPTIKVARDYVSGNVVLTQEVELSFGDHIWKIPINYVSSVNKIDFENTKADFWMVDKKASFNVSAKGWLILNKQHSGYYRVNYDKQNWDRIIHTLKEDDFEKIHVLNRAQLLYDAFYFASLGKISVDIPFRMAEYLEKERDYVAFAAFYNSMLDYCEMYNGRFKQSEIDYFLNHPLRSTISFSSSSEYAEHYLVFQAYIRSVMSGIRNYLGKENKPNEPALDAVNRLQMQHFFQSYFE